uniref:coiled-coil domain-containing protein 150-like isoform X2 n=1 Tax=Myxine glutinosa TaxID=7769 RepID=UPI00358FDF19
MARPSLSPLHSVETATPEASEVLNLRLAAVETEAECLARDLAELEFWPTNLIFGPVSTNLTELEPAPGKEASFASPVRARQAFGSDGQGYWKEYETLVGRVCRVESAVHGVKMAVSRLKVEREQEAVITKERARSLHDDVSELRSSLAERSLCLADAERTRDELWDECKHLTSVLDVATASKGELVHMVDKQSKMVKRLEKQIQQLKNELSRESDRRFAVKESHDVLLERVNEMERSVVAEKEQEERAMGVQSQQIKLSNESGNDRSKELEDELSHLRTEMQRRKVAWREAKNLIMARQEQLQSTIAHLEREAREMNQEMATVVGEQQCFENIAAQRKNDNERVEKLLVEATESNNELAFEKGKLQCQLTELKKQVVSLPELQKEHTRLERLNTELRAMNTKVCLELNSCKGSMQQLEKLVLELKDSLHRKDLEFSRLTRLHGDNLQEKERLLGQLRDVEGREIDRLSQCEKQRTELFEDLSGAQRKVARFEGLLSQTMEERNKSCEELKKLQNKVASLQEKLRETESLRNRDMEANREQAGVFASQLDSLGRNFRAEQDKARKAAARQIGETKRMAEDERGRTAELSRANRELRQRLKELEEAALAHQSLRRARLGESRKIKEVEAELDILKRLRKENEKHNAQQVVHFERCERESQQLMEEVAALNSACNASSTQVQHMEVELQEERTQRQKSEEKMAHLMEKNTELKHKLLQASYESQQVSASLKEAQEWFRLKFERLQAELKMARQKDSSIR